MYKSHVHANQNSIIICHLYRPKNILLFPETYWKKIGARMFFFEHPIFMRFSLLTVIACVLLVCYFVVLYVQIH
jgi:hypothetical protein